MIQESTAVLTREIRRRGTKARDVRKKCQKSSPIQIFSLTTFGVIQIVLVVFVCTLDFGRFPPFVYIL